LVFVVAFSDISLQNIKKGNVRGRAMIEDKGGIAPCGKYPDDTQHEQWRQEASCCVVGCKLCGLYDGGEIYYEHSEQNMKRGLAIWAKYELGRLGYE
jgi:hypothetical protein